MRTFVIAEYRARLMANRLWAKLAIRAYALEVGAGVIDISWLEHTPLARVLEKISRPQALWALGAPKPLPPSGELTEKFTAQKTLWFYGWMFKNPVGLAKHRTKLLAGIAPSRSLSARVAQTLAQYPTNRIGVHYRTTPFPGFADGEYLVSRERMLEAARQYAHERGWQEGQYGLVEVTDQAPYCDDVEGLHLLAHCDAVVDDNSTYGNLAAWIGDIPHVVVTSADIDWLYYRGKTSYFDNQYATYVR